MTPFVDGPYRRQRRPLRSYLSTGAVQASVFVIVLAAVLAICYATGLIK